MFPALGDAQVSTIGSHILARSFHAISAGPQVREIYGVEENNSTVTTGSGVVEWRYLDSEPVTFVGNYPAPGPTDTHECPRHDKRGFLMMKSFCEGGVISNQCHTYDYNGRCIKEKCLEEPQYDIYR